MAEQTQEGQKTVVSFIVGLLIGGLLVWAFSGPAQVEENSDVAKETTTSEETSDQEEQNSDVAETTTPTETETTETPKPTLSVGEGKITVADQAASASIKLTSATYPVSEGWVGVREYNDERLGSILGVVRFSESQGLVPADIILQRPTIAGRTYAVVVYTESGDRQFNLADDKQLDTIYATFTAE